MGTGNTNDLLVSACSNHHNSAQMEQYLYIIEAGVRAADQWGISAKIRKIFNYLSKYVFFGGIRAPAPALSNIEQCPSIRAFAQLDQFCTRFIE